MVLYINFYLEKLKNNILSNIDKDIDPFLKAEFIKSINNIALYWDDIKDRFIQNIEYTYTLEEQMVFTILADKLRDDFLDKKPMYTSILIFSLLASDKFVVNYPLYTKVLLSKPFYDAIRSVQEKCQFIRINELFSMLLEQMEGPYISEEDYNFLLKSLKKAANESYEILINENNSLMEIYYIIKKKMEEENKDIIIFNQDDFDTLKTISKYVQIKSKEDLGEIKNKIIDIENNYYSAISIIKEVLNMLNEYNKVIPIARIRQIKRDK